MVIAFGMQLNENKTALYIIQPTRSVILYFSSRKFLYCHDPGSYLPCCQIHILKRIMAAKWFLCHIPLCQDFCKFQKLPIVRTLWKHRPNQGSRGLLLQTMTCKDRRHAAPISNHPPTTGCQTPGVKNRKVMAP